MEIFGLIGVNVCYLKMISGNIGLFQILDFQKLGLNFNFVLNTLPNDSFLFNIFSYSCIWLKLLRLEIYENLRLKKIGSGKHWAILLLLCHIICRTDWCHSLLRRIIKIRRHSEKQKKSISFMHVWTDNFLDFFPSLMMVAGYNWHSGQIS